MTRYVALLRGINLGPNRRIAMADLREILTDLGHSEVKTHLQSGNAVFASSITDPDEVVRGLEQRIKAEFGVAVPCLVRTGPQMRAVVDANPLADVALDPSRHVVTFLSAPVDAAALAALDPAGFAPDQVQVIGREVYSWHPEGIRDSKFAKLAWAKRFGVVASARNWNTVTRLTEMSAE